MQPQQPHTPQDARPSQDSSTPQDARPPEGSYAPQDSYTPQSPYASQGPYAPQSAYTPQVPASRNPYASQAPSTPQAPFVPAPAAAEQRPGNRTKIVVLSLAAGLVLGAAGTGAAWALSSGPAPTGGTPESDARGACEALAGFDEKKYMGDGPARDIAFNRYMAAGALSAAAAAGDPAYKELAEVIRRSQDRHNAVFGFDAKVKKDLDRARAICNDL